MFILPRSLRSILPAAALALSMIAGPRVSSAQTSPVTSFAIGVEHAEAHPYNYTGRIFDLDNFAIASGTLVRRHTVLTAGHVVFDPTNGFIVHATFTRGLYEDVSFQKSQIIAVNALTGYQTAVASFTNTSLQAFSFDMGYALVSDAPVDQSWGTYVADPSLLADSSNQFFVLGYPGVTFDGLTMAYIVPTSTFTEVGGVGSGLYENDGYSPEPGESGGPIYVYPGDFQLITGETVGGADDPSGEFNATFIRAIDKNANTFLTSAEYTNGLIKKVKIKGPRTVSAGQTYTYTAQPIFTVPDIGSTKNATTVRYGEIRLKSSTPGTKAQPVVTIEKLSTTEFRVTFASSIRAKTTTTLSAYFTKTDPVQNSTITITVQ